MRKGLPFGIGLVLLAGGVFLIPKIVGQDASPGGQVSRPSSRLDRVGEPSLGPPDAPVVIVEFSDYLCQFCRDFHASTFPRLLRRYRGRIRYVVRNFPLSDADPMSQIAAEAAECANDQHKFWEYHERLFADARFINVSDLKRYAVEVGMDGDRLWACIDSTAKRGAVQADLADAHNAGVEAAPTFFINGTKLVGAQPIEAFQELIDRAVRSS